MIRRFCDGCEVELDDGQNVVEKRLDSNYESATGRIIHVVVIAGTGAGASNAGDLCPTCVGAAVAQAVKHRHVASLATARMVNSDD